MNKLGKQFTAATGVLASLTPHSALHPHCDAPQI